jgi:hypothetical protein
MVSLRIVSETVMDRLAVLTCDFRVLHVTPHAEPVILCQSEWYRDEAVGLHCGVVNACRGKPDRRGKKSFANFIERG